jgi:putative transposase
MPRKVRIEFPGARYHIMSRGDHREPIFLSDEDRIRFLETLGEACEKTGWQIHAYCLMPNHFHLALETPQPNLVAGMKWLLGTYTIRHNATHRLSGHLFSGRYKSLIIDPSRAPGYLRIVCEYIHLNPSRAKLLPPEEPLEEYRWSSYPAYLSPKERPPWLRTETWLGELGIQKESRQSLRELSQHVERRRLEEEEKVYAPIRRGWFLGSKESRQEFLSRFASGKRLKGQGEIWREVMEERAEILVGKLLKSRKWDEERLKREKKWHEVKLEIAERLRKETTMTVPWIAKRLRMSSPNYLYILLYRRQSSAE